MQRRSWRLWDGPVAGMGLERPTRPFSRELPAWGKKPLSILTSGDEAGQ